MIRPSRFLILAISLCLILALAATLGSYIFSYTESWVVDASIIYHGWPLCWVIESWSLWSPVENPHIFNVQPFNFLVDIVFWAVVFQLPSLALLLLKGTKKPLNIGSPS